MNKIKNFFESGKMLSRAVATMVVLATLVFCFSKISTAKMTYTITDADNTTVIESTSDDMESIISDAGIVLTDNDSYVMNKVGSTSYEISILRFKQVELYYGEYHVETLTQCATVGELLDKMGIDTEKISAINHGNDKEIYDGMTIRIA